MSGEGNRPSNQRLDLAAIRERLEYAASAQAHRKFARPSFCADIQDLLAEIERLRAALNQILAEAVPMGEDRGNFAIEQFARSALSGEPIDVRKYPSLCRNPNKGGGYCPDCGQVHSAIEWPRVTDETTGEHTK